MSLNNSIIKTATSQLFKALQNERCLDVHFRDHSNIGPILSKLPNFKLLKQVALYNRLGYLYFFFINISIYVIPINIIFQFIVAVAISATSKKTNNTHPVHIIATSKTNFDIIKARYSDVYGHSQVSFDYDIYSLKGLSSRLDVVTLLAAFASCVKLYLSILRGKCDEKMDLLLHCHDAFILSMLIYYVVKTPQADFVTDDHYQRWAFLLSNLSNKLTTVQHGFIDPDINFINSFGTINELYVYDFSFKIKFNKYFSITNCILHKSNLTLQPNRNSLNSVFLASSFPAIDTEIELVDIIKKKTTASIIIKLHPCHSYDARKDILLSYASYVCRDDEFPECRAFVSYNSFLEYDYRLCGVLTFSIANGGVNDTAQSLIELFSAENHQ